MMGKKLPAITSSARVKTPLLFLFGAVLLTVLLRPGRHIQQFDALGIDLVDLVADDDLVLAALVHDAHDALGGFDGVGLGLGCVLQAEAQPGGAVAQVRYIFFSADFFNDAGSQFCILHCFLLPRVLYAGSGLRARAYFVGIPQLGRQPLAKGAARLDEFGPF